jgi:hypothetical protein
MKHQQRSWLGAWVLAFTIVFRVMILYYMHQQFRYTYIAGEHVSLGFFDSVSIEEKIMLGVLLLELVMYLFIRNNISNIQWVRWHVWSLLFAVVILPMIIMMMYFLSRAGKSDESFFRFLLDVRLYLFWGLIAIGHVFFIATIAKSFTAQKVPADEGPPGLLDEFVD